MNVEHAKATATHDRRQGLVARRGDLPDLSALLPGHQRRRHRRPPGIIAPPALHRRARRRCDLDLALLHLADEGFRLRRVGLLRRRSDVRHARRFRRADGRGAPARPQGDDRPGHVAHLRPASLVHAKAAPARTNPKADWYVWADPKPDGTPPNNWLSIFGGSAWQWDTRALPVLPAQFPDRAAGPQLPQPRRAGRAAGRSCGSGSIAASTASGSTRSTSTSTSQGLRGQPALPRRSATTSIAPAVNPYNYQDHLYDKSQPENLAFLEALPRAARRISGRRRGRRSGRCAARAGDRRRNTPPAATRCTCATPSTSWRPIR